MKLVLLFTTILFLILPASLAAQFGDIINDIEETVNETVQGSAQGLSEEEIIEGLKEALETGTKNSVDFVSKTDGYFKTPEIKIPLPENLKNNESLLRTAGFGNELDEFVLSLNRAAENAAPEAKDIFWDAIRQMSFSDAKKILEGEDNAATLYFEDKTRAKLNKAFKPIVSEALNSVGVTSLYKSIMNKLESIPFSVVKTCDLDSYATRLALDGMFFMLAQEEKKIRTDPAARITDILKKVFGG